MDPPTADQRPQEGVLNVRDFSIRGESTLERVAANSGDPNRALPHAVVRRRRDLLAHARGIHPLARQARGARRRGVGPGDGRDHRGPRSIIARDDVRMRGTFVPAYALNNFLARVPIVGLFIGGGQNEGVFGMTYEVVGPTGNATLRVNPMSMMAPGFLRKIFEFRNGDDRTRCRRCPRRHGSSSPAQCARNRRSRSVVRNRGQPGLTLRLRAARPGMTATPASAARASCARARA